MDDKEKLKINLQRELRGLGFALDTVKITEEEYQKRKKEIEEKINDIDAGKYIAVLQQPEAKKEGKYRLELIVPGCIMCGACQKMNPYDWSWNDNQKAELINGEKIFAGNGTLIKEKKFVDDLKNNVIVAECCPVKVIHVFENATNKKLMM